MQGCSLAPGSHASSDREPGWRRCFFIDTFAQLHEGEKRRISISQRYLRRPRGLSISVRTPALSSQAHFSTSRCPFLFIICIYSALTEILIFDMKTSCRNAKMGSTCAVLEMLSSFNMADVCWLSVRGESRRQEAIWLRTGGQNQAFFNPSTADLTELEAD